MTAASAIASSLDAQKLRPILPSYLIALTVATLISAVLGGTDSGLATVSAIESVAPHLAVPKPSNATSPFWTIRPWPRNSYQPAPGNPGAVHSKGNTDS